MKIESIALHDPAAGAEAAWPCTETPPQFILTLSCADRRGIVQAVAGLLNDVGCNIIESAQFSDIHTHAFFMRVQFASELHALDVAALKDRFARLGAAMHMRWQIHEAGRRTRVMLLVSKIGHCLNDLLFRMKSALLPIDVVAVVSNHDDFRQLAKDYDVPFHHLPLSAAPSDEERQAQEERMLRLAEANDAELLILARYMQVLSPAFCRKLDGRIINIHHSFLPSFKGGRPYFQAYERGVKLIGATAHFVTDQLDEGPIIEQDVARADHTMTPKELTAIGRDAECVVLARAVKWFAERRIQLNGNRTVILR